MTREEIIEGNKLIAKFEGAEELDKSSGLLDSSLCLDMLHPIKNKKEYISLTELKYHSSWDWLMPVVEKIESTDPLGGIVMIQQGMCRITSRMLGDNSIKASNDNYFLLGVKGKLLSTYKSVVEYIKWYNENKHIS